MKEDNTIRKGDTVRIVNPEFFIRCGYDNSMDINRQKVLGQWDKQIDNFIKTTVGPTRSFGVEDYPRVSAKKKIVDALAYVLLKESCRDGAERKLFTESKPQYKDKEITVLGIKFVKTGQYMKPSGGYDYYGEYDFDPGGLVGEKTHKILDLGYYGFENNPLMIEACHVEKVKDGRN